MFGLASGALVIAANGWMNAPAGFTWVDGRATDIDPWAAMFNDAWALQAIHMLVAAFQATSMAAIGFHAWALRRGAAVAFHRRAVAYLVPTLIVSSLMQPVIGDLSAKSVAERQPAKLAAADAPGRSVLIPSTGGAGRRRPLRDPASPASSEGTPARPGAPGSTARPAASG